MLKKIIRYIPGVAIPMIINFILTLLYATFLEPGEYGILNVYLNTIQIIYSATISIFQNAALRFYSLKNEYRNDKEFISTYILASAGTSAVLLLLLYLSNLVRKYNWWIIALSVGCNGLFQLFCNIYRVKYDSKKYNNLRTFSAGLSLVGLVIFSRILSPLSYVWPIVAIYGSYGILSAYEFFHFRKSIKINSFSIPLLKSSIKYGLPLIGVSLLGSLIASSDQYFLLFFLEEEAVGNYALGHRLVDALVINLLTMILLVMTPELNHIHDDLGEQHSKEVLKKMINAAIWIILPLSLAIVVYASSIIKFIFPEYRSAGRIMQLVVFASMFHGVSMFTCKGLELAKQTKYVFWSLLTATAINCLYNLVFIPIYGINASAHSSLLAYIVYNALLIAFTKKYYTLSFDSKYILKVVVVSLVTIIVAELMKFTKPIDSIWILAIELLVSVATYLSLSCLFGLLKVFK